MIVKSVENITKVKGKRILALDISKKRIGVAVSDYTLEYSFPYEVIFRTKLSEDLTKILQIIQKENFFLIVIGYPLGLDSKKNSRTQSIDAFVKNLEIFLNQNNIKLDMYLQDERFSTIMSKNPFDEKQSKDETDDSAAAYFLSHFLEKFRSSKIKM